MIRCLLHFFRETAPYCSGSTTATTARQQDAFGRSGGGNLAQLRTCSSTLQRGCPVNRTDTPLRADDTPSLCTQRPLRILRRSVGATRFGRQLLSRLMVLLYLERLHSGLRPQSSPGFEVQAEYQAIPMLSICSNLPFRNSRLSSKVAIAGPEVLLWFTLTSYSL